jgi:HK97 family phage portal protein
MGFVRDLIWGPQRLAREDATGPAWPDPIPGTEVGMWPQVWWFWEETYGMGAVSISPAMAERVWVASRCIQLNAQQIASMPLRFDSTAPEGGYEPAWVSNPDPNWFPNGISDAVFAVVSSMYGWGFACLYVTSRYATGFPQAWTVLDPSQVLIEMRNGRRAYKLGDRELDDMDVIQIDRNPGWGLHGSSALKPYATQAWGLLAAGELGRSIMQGGVPQTVLKSERKLTKEQAEALQSQWMTRVSERGGAPPILPPELSFESLSLSPSDLLLIEAQEWNSKVIASAYGVPAVFLNMGVEGSHIYQSPSALGEAWWRFELRPTAKRIADALSAQALPKGSWVTFDAADTFAPLVPGSEENDPQLSLSQVADASPADQPGQVRPLKSIGGNR